MPWGALGGFLVIGRIQFIIIPLRGVFVDIFYMFVIILAIADDMVVEMSLPNVFAIFLVAKNA